MEVINPKGKNLIVGCICGHPSMNPIEFIDAYKSNLHQKISKMILIDDFNINLLKYGTNADSTAFLDSADTNSFLPYITQNHSLIIYF